MDCKNAIQEDLARLGICPGDMILMHSSYKSLGEVEGGAETFFEAFLEFLGENGTLILPALSFSTVTREQPVFDKAETPSCVGYLTEYFRTKVPGVVRSLHATHSCCAVGKYAQEVIAGHELDATPVGEHSPFAKLPKYGGKILMLGCGTRCNTSMHGVEETAEKLYYIDEAHPIEYSLRDGQREIRKVSVRHHFYTEQGEHIAQRYDRLIPLLEGDECRVGKVLEAECYLLDAKAVWKKGQDTMEKNPRYFVQYPGEKD